MTISGFPSSQSLTSVRKRSLSQEVVEEDAAAMVVVVFAEDELLRLMAIFFRGLKDVRRERWKRYVQLVKDVMGNSSRNNVEADSA